MKKTELEHFKALIDVFLNSIARKNYTLVSTISRFLYDAFKKERDKAGNNPVVYPNAYYELIYKTIEDLAQLNNRKFAAIEKRTSGGIWLLGELQGHKISDITYTWLWRNLILAIQYEKDNMILDHWETSHQYISYSLDFIQPDYNYSSSKLEIKNEEQVNNRKQEREKFLEFHYALGGLLMYKHRYLCIKQIFDYTTSHPPKYELLPDSMSDIFHFYNEFRDPYEMKYTWISSQYPFPDLRGINSDYVIKKWISSYFAILFLRQYTINPYLITMKPLDFPILPKTQSEIKNWIDGLDFFKNLVSEHLNNKELISSMNLDFITPEWCELNEKIYPLDFIDTLKEKLLNEYKQNAITIPISKEKIAQFENSTKEIIEKRIDSFNHLSNKVDFTGETDKWYVNGQRMLQSKDAFSETPEVHHIDFDSFLASVLSRNISDGIASTFFYKKSDSYLLKQEDIFKAIDKLNISNEYLIVSFGINIEHYINYLKVPNLSLQKYKDIEIHTYDGSRLVGSSLFLLKKTDLPFISTKNIEKEQIEKYSLNKISDSINLHTSIIDLNTTTKEIFNENKDSKEEDEIRKSVLMSIIISTEIKWKKNVNVINLVEYSEYRQKGLPNSLNDITKEE
jgi:hypothetical protein